MKKHIIREVPTEQIDFSLYFEDDFLTDLFIISSDRWGRLDGFNVKEYERIKEQAQAIIEGFNDVDEGYTNYDGRRITYKQIMEDEGLTFNPTLCGKLRKWVNDGNDLDALDVANYLTITTGKCWTASSAHGYRQGDYVEIVYNSELYPNARKFGEVWLGAAKEFCVIDLDADGQEGDTVYGYIVADCEGWNEQTYKRLVCEQAGIEPEETTLEMIRGQHTYTKYDYETVA